MLTRIDWFARVPGVSPGLSVFVLSTVSGPVWAAGLSLLAKPRFVADVWDGFRAPDRLFGQDAR